MPSRVYSTDQLQESLSELENAYNICRATLCEGTVDLGLEQFENTFCFDFEGEDLKQIILLAFKDYSDTRRNIVSHMTALPGHTIVKEDRPVTWEIEEIAKEFCKNHGLISDLIKCLNQAEVLFPEKQSIVAEYDCFHAEDYEEEGHIVIRISVASDQETAFKEYHALQKWMLENLSDNSLQYFVVTVSRMD